MSEEADVGLRLRASLAYPDTDSPNVYKVALRIPVSQELLEDSRAERAMWRVAFWPSDRNPMPRFRPFRWLPR